MTKDRDYVGDCRDILRRASEAASAHRKCAVSLRNIHSRLEKKYFHEVFWTSLLPLFANKRGTIECDRALKFIDFYFEFLEKEWEEALPQLVEFLLRRLIQGFQAKSVPVRYRLCQLTFYLLNHLTEIDDNIYDGIKQALIQRVKDKDAHVRKFASIALSRLQGPTEDYDMDVATIMMEMLESDPSADVRKSVLLNLDLNEHTADAIVKRARDFDKSVRRYTYIKFRQNFHCISLLDSMAREKFFKSGLNDRDPTVKNECLEMLCEQLWVNAETDLYNFAKVLDVFSSDTAEISLKSLMLSPKFEKASLDTFYGLMKTEKLDYINAFVVRIAINLSAEAEAVDSVLEKLPTLCEICDMMLLHFGAMVQAPSEEIAVEREFLLKQLIMMVEYYDFSDELGRRSFIDLAKELLQTSELPPDFIPILLRILKLHIKEDEMFLHVAEVVCEMTDSESNGVIAVDGDATSSVVALQALEITRSALEISEKALAEENANFFLFCLNSGESKDIKLKSLQIIFDLVMIHGTSAFVEETLLGVAKVALSSADTKILTVAVEGTAKLLRSSFISDIIEAFIVLYFHPHTATNQRLRQCLSFFMPWYALSSHVNQQTVAKAYVPALATLSGIYELATSADITLVDVLKQMAEWTDTRFIMQNDKNKDEERDVTHCHLDIFCGLMDRVIIDTDFGITACTALSTLYIEPKVWADNAEKLMGLVSKVNMILIHDTAAIKLIKRFLLKVQSQ
ncbi:hypothetical protein HDU67_009660 [Dinochytrium kinnereticum]|nr:hypothetical protein HDU67_009660 [Dinochytrium kinnereticum]